jgi:small conductance mechanosensitive channel
LVVFAIVFCGTNMLKAADANVPTEATAENAEGTQLSIGTAQEVLTKIYTYLAEYGLKIVAAVLIFIIGRWAAALAAKLVSKALIRAHVDETLVSFLSHLTKIGILVFVVIAALAKMGLQTASFVAVLGAAGLAVGLALQGSLSNFASGVLMLIFKPIRVGDFVEAGGAKGSVKEIGIFTTVLNSPDNVRIIVPNSQVTGNSISNYTINGTRRVDMVIGVSYEDDLKKAREVIEKVLAGDDRILPDPAPLVAVSELADSSVNFVVRPWVKVTDYWPTYFDLTAEIKVALEKKGITIPFPQRDVHVKNGELAAATK